VPPATCCLLPLGRVSPPFHHTLKQQSVLPCSRQWSWTSRFLSWQQCQISFSLSWNFLSWMCCNTDPSCCARQISPSLSVTCSAARSASVAPILGAARKSFAFAGGKRCCRRPEQDSCGPVLTQQDNFWRAPQWKTRLVPGHPAFTAGYQWSPVTACRFTGSFSTPSAASPNPRSRQAWC